MKPYISSIFRDPNVLRTVSSDLGQDDIRTSEIQKLIKTLTDECIKEQYLGFSPQNFAGLDIYPSIILGIVADDNFKRISETPTVIINPKIISSHGEFLRIDGCAGINLYQGNSGDGDIVGMWVEKYRPDNITFEGLSIEGEPIKQTYTGVQAHALHHELEHTQGVLMTDNHDGDLVIRELANGEYVLMSTDDPEIPREKSIDGETRFDFLGRLKGHDNKNPIDFDNLVVPTKDGDKKVICTVEFE